MAESNQVARKAETIIDAPFKDVGGGFVVSNVKFDNFTEKMNPFLHVDHFNMGESFFPPHPHAGFCPITFVFEDSPGTIQNRDTIEPGVVTLIKPGDLFWSTAASGLVHEEIPHVEGVVCHGLQIFVNLEGEHKEWEPRHDHLKAQDIPVVTSPTGVRVRVVVGEHGSVSSPLQPLTPVHLLDVSLPKGSTFSHQIPEGWNVFVLTFKGCGTFGDHRVDKMQAISFADQGSHIEYLADEDSHFVVMAGRPISEEVHVAGTFVGNSSIQVYEFQMAYVAGRMGRLRPSQRT